MTREEAIKYLKSGCLGLNCSYHIKNRCNDDYEVREARKDEAIKMAIADMEKQIPKKPIGKYTDYKCSVCGRRVRSGKGSSSRQRDNFCQRCGQALDWSEEDD